LTDTDDPTLAAARLEEALERIAALTARLASAREADPAAPEIATVAVAERLDALIARLRAALAGRPA
jgi:hypothetical protein